MTRNFDTFRFLAVELHCFATSIFGFGTSQSNCFKLATASTPFNMSSDNKTYYSAVDESPKKGKLQLNTLEIDTSPSGLNSEVSESWMGSTARMNVMDTISSFKSGEMFNSLESTDHHRNYVFATNASWVVNWFLLGVKIYAVIVSSSKAVTAAMVDSVVDILSQVFSIDYT